MHFNTIRQFEIVFSKISNNLQSWKKLFSKIENLFFSEKTSHRPNQYCSRRFRLLTRKPGLIQHWSILELKLSLKLIRIQ